MQHNKARVDAVNRVVDLFVEQETEKIVPEDQVPFHIRERVKKQQKTGKFLTFSPSQLVFLSHSVNLARTRRADKVGRVIFSKMVTFPS